MSNWVTLPNGVHIDLDDPNNPLTGDGSFESYLGGSDSGSGSKGSYKSNLKMELKSRIRENQQNGITTKNSVKNAIRSFLDDNPDATNKDIVEAMNSFAYSVRGKMEWSEDDINKLMLTNSGSGSGKDSKSFDRDLELAFKELGGDENAILDALRSTGKDYGMSNGDLQGVVEAYVMTHGNKDDDDDMSVFAMAKEMGMSPAEVGSYNRTAIKSMYNDYKNKTDLSKVDFSKPVTLKAKGEGTIKIEGIYNGMVQYKERGASGVWQRFHEKPKELKERLSQRGYKPSTK